MFTLGTDNGKEITLNYAKRFFLISIFVLVFGFVYELFGHGVYSNYMIYAFSFPLFLGTGFWGIMHGVKKNISINRVFINLWTAMIATYTVGFVYKGILDIYGTDGNLTKVYWIVGTIFLISAIASMLLTKRK